MERERRRFGRHALTRGVFAADGLVSRIEWFEPEQAADALARFDALTTTTAASPPPVRRIRPNAALDLVSRFQAAFAAADDAALGALFGGELEVVDHPNGATYGRAGHFKSLRGLRRARDPVLRFEPIATLGASLALCRRHIHASGMTRERFDVGLRPRRAGSVRAARGAAARLRSLPSITWATRSSACINATPSR